MLLSSLLSLKNFSMTVTTLDNGQVNIAVYSENKAPLTINCSADDSYQAEQEIMAYCGKQAPVTNVSVGEPISSEKAAPKKQAKKAAPKKEKTDAPEPPKQEQEPQHCQPLFDEDDILDQF
ncbi:hypothetical protein [Salinivibrio costicola]|uniref:hypothetical protein n=1 Tax=Salinivibrio costicola TaxID=51367 RepID=UPI00046E6444|nr:hypothetical protein [Salinivibrio costicola]